MALRCTAASGRCTSSPGCAWKYGAFPVFFRPLDTSATKPNPPRRRLNRTAGPRSFPTPSRTIPAPARRPTTWSSPPRPGSSTRGRIPHGTRAAAATDSPRRRPGASRGAVDSSGSGRRCGWASARGPGSQRGGLSCRPPLPGVLSNFSCPAASPQPQRTTGRLSRCRAQHPQPQSRHARTPPPAIGQSQHCLAGRQPEWHHDLNGGRPEIRRAQEPSK